MAKIIRFSSCGFCADGRFTSLEDLKKSIKTQTRYYKCHISDKKIESLWFDGVSAKGFESEKKRGISTGRWILTFEAEDITTQEKKRHIAEMITKKQSKLVKKVLEGKISLDLMGEIAIRNKKISDKLGLGIKF